MQTWLITGASRGFGLLVAQEALRRGDRVIATARRVDGLAEHLAAPAGQAVVVPLDVTDHHSIASAVAAGLDRFGNIDVLFNNAGHGLVGAIEEIPDDAARAVFDVNVFGVLAVTREVLPGMRAQRSGTIINVSSVGGRIASAGWGVYSATKFAVSALSDALRAEVAPLGIRVTSVEPGRFRTDFLDPSSLATGQSIIEDYDATAGATRRWAADNNHNQPGDPAKAAQVIVDLASQDATPARLPLGSDCVARFDDLIDEQRRSLDEWRPVSVSTDY